LTAFDRGPGLYWREDVPRAETDQTTGIAGFVGYVVPSGGTDVSGLVGSAHALTRWEELEALLGGAETDPFLAAAVRGFFENGGKRCRLALMQDSWSRMADHAERQRLLGDAFDQALARLEEIAEIDLVAAPFLMGLEPEGGDRTPLYAMQQRLLKLCADRRDCFALLDAPAGVVPIAALKAQWQALSIHEGAASGALYHPWVRVPGGCRTCRGTGRAESAGYCSSCAGTGAASVPPSGHLAGIYARVDQRVGVFRAPANEEIEGIIDLDHVLADADHVALNDTGLNLLRAFPARGLRVWGARTLSTDPAWRWISVRRLFLTIGRWLSRAMLNVVFEPNDLRLWIRIDRELTAWLERLYRAGALKGRNAAEAFYVRCNDELNPLEVREQGMLVVEVGLAPAVPQEYIVLRLVRGADGISMTTG
jgi:hypothetical protein